MYVRSICTAIVIASSIARAESPTDLVKRAADEVRREASTTATSRATTTSSTTRSTTTRATTRRASSRPATRLAAFPTPGELFKQMADAKAATQAKAQVAVIDVSGGFDERAAAGFNVFGGGGNSTFRELVERIKHASEDASVRAVLFTTGEGTSMNLAQVQEIRGEIARLRKASKRVFVYGDAYDTQSYLLASAATDVCLLQAGEVFIPGISIETQFYKGILDKVGVKADYVQIGEFKGAEEPYTRSDPSPELRGELERLTTSLMNQVVDGIGESRNLSGDKVRAIVDEALLPAERAKQAGLVDHLVDIDGLRDLLKSELGEEVNLLADYGATAGPDVDFSNPFAILGAMAKRPEETALPKVAVIYAQGVIVDGEGGGGGNPLLGGGERQVGGEAMRRAFRLALRDDNVKAIVVRIDSPGGSAMASEVMWQAMRRVAEKKPTIVSIGHMAASGGYYLASAGDTIYADPSAIVGSIGVVGGKIALGGLYEKLGIGTAAFNAGKNADIYSSTTEWTDAQRTMIRRWMKGTYDQFTDRIKTTRGEKIADIDKIARGRIFTASEAKTLGMVDTLGGLDAAIGEAARRAKIDGEPYDLKTLPPPPTMQEMLGGKAGGGASTLSPVLAMLPGEVRQSLGQSIAMGEMLQRRPVVLMTPYVLRVR